MPNTYRTKRDGKTANLLLQCKRTRDEFTRLIAATWFYILNVVQVFWVRASELAKIWPAGTGRGGGELEGRGQEGLMKT
jgi:hypothetical protein